MATYRLPENREAPPFLETELIPPLFISFEKIFNAIGEPFPEPDLGMGLGYKGPKPAYDVGPAISASFRGSLIECFIQASVDLEERNRIINLAIEKRAYMPPEHRGISRHKVTPDRVVVDAIEAAAGPQWKLLFDKKTALVTFQENFRPDNPHSRWSLEIKPPGRITPPRESLRISFPDSELVEELGLLVPKVKYETRGERGIAQNRRAIEYREQLRTFAGAVLKEFDPFLDYWYALQKEKFSENAAILRVLKERDRRVSEILRFVINPPAIRG